MPTLAARQPPPADYYAANLRTLIERVLGAHGDLLSDRERGYFESLIAASVGAQRLYARLLSRSRPWVRIDKLNYREIESLPAAIAELSEVGLISVCARLPADALLGLFTQVERKRLFPDLPVAPKARWIELCVSRYPDGLILGRVGECFPWIAIADYDAISLGQLLFFGSERQDMSTFVLQDLGLLRFEDYSLDSSLRMFDNRETLGRYLYFRRLRHLAHRTDEVPMLDAWLSRALWQPADNRFEQRHRDRALQHLGHRYERAGAIDEALCCYARGRSPPARERRVRLLERLADEQGAAALTSKMLESPRAAEEEDFAERRTSAISQPSRRARIEQTRVPYVAGEDVAGKAPTIEEHAARLLQSQGGRVWHLENQLPLGLAGLAYWEVVFAPIAGAFVNPFQFGPLDLMSEDFALQRAEVLARRNEELAEPGRFATELQRTHAAKQGIANRLVSWAHFDGTLVRELIEGIPEARLRTLARYVIEHLNRARRGFPDLLVIYEPGRFEFVEVKGPTDQLQPAQRIWFKVLDELGFPARVLKFHT